MALASVAVLVAASCAPTTPAQRIAQNPGMLEGLSEKQRELVSKGQIATGMPRDGVFLAWGGPDRRAEGFREGGSFERWDYMSLRPVYYHGFGGYSGHGWGSHHGHCYGWGYHPTVDYVPVKSASVWFREERVDSWERGRVSP